jgi:hypothetical protein
MRERERIIIIVLIFQPESSYPTQNTPTDILA